MKVNAINESTKEVIQIDAITSKIDTTSLDSSVKTYETIISYLVIDGQKVDLNIDNTFYHPINNQVYSIQEK